MTINNTANKVVAAGNGVMTVFNFSFVGVKASDISVIYTDASGNETTLLSTQYLLTLNAAPPGQIWGIGGTVTYPLVGSPIALGTTLTIVRNLPLLQEVALGNQGNEFPSAVETALDLLTMALQQVSELFQRAIVAPIVDPSAPLPLPPAAQRANLALVFDANGNPVAGAIPGTGVISSAMQPVVDAATLALGRTAFGLGAMAVEGIGAGLQDDGARNARVCYGTVADATNQIVTSAFHLTQRIATAPSLAVSLVYTLPRANTLFNGFGFWIYAKSGNTTLTPNANDNFDGLASGVSVSVPQGSWAWVTTDAASSGTWHIEYNGENVALQASCVGNALVITLNATALKFRDPTLTAGDQIWQNIPNGLNITVPQGATLGSPGSSTPFRVWIFACHNGGTPVLAVVIATIVNGATINIAPVATWETDDVSGIAISSSATSGGALYSASGFSNDSVRLLGYVAFDSGQASAGTWATSPSKVQNISPGMKLPGDVVQVASATTSVAITPRAKANLIRLKATATNITPGIASVQFTRNSSAIGLSQTGGISATSSEMPVGMEMIDAPGVNVSTTYGIQNSAGGGSLANIVMIAEELMA